MSLVKTLIEAGIHYGHSPSGWNPKMRPYIYGKRNGVHIIDVRETIKGLLLAKKFITRLVADGKDVLFVGTKRQARPILEAAGDDTGMPYVSERWLGGTLTNFRTIRSRLKRLEELEQLMDSEEWENYSKKMASQLTRERKKISRNLGGIREMDRLPGALIIIDVRREHNAIKEARKLGIPTVCLIDTDSDPDFADLPIPGNDDAMKAIELVVKQLSEAVKEGKTARAQEAASKRKGGEEPAEGAPKPKRRSRRASFRADDVDAVTERERLTQLAAETEKAAREAEKQAEKAAAPITPNVAEAVSADQLRQQLEKQQTKDTDTAGQETETDSAPADTTGEPQGGPQTAPAQADPAAEAAQGDQPDAEAKPAAAEGGDTGAQATDAGEGKAAEQADAKAESDVEDERSNEK